MPKEMNSSNLPLYLRLFSPSHKRVKHIHPGDKGMHSQPAKMKSTQQ